jgi:putative ABC transport system permease protein
MVRHYLVLGIKVLLRRKFFTFISLFGVALTLTVLVLVAAFMDHVFGARAPETRQDRMLGVYSVQMWGSGDGTWQSGGGFKLFDTYARNLPGAERLSIYQNGTVQTFVDGQKVPLSVKRTDADFFEILQFTFLEGRPYSAEEAAQAAFVGVISDRVRQRLFNGQPAMGRVVEANGQRFQVIGVVQNVSELRLVPFADLWVPIATIPGDAYRENLMGGFNAIVLAKDRASLAGIRDEFNARLARIELPDRMEGILAPFETKFEWVARQMRLGDRHDPNSQAPRLVILLMVLGMLFALLPTVNLVNLNVSRIMERASEIGVRKAFGARSSTLVVQFVIENVLLTLVGALIALLLSALVLRAINQNGTLTEQVGVNFTVLGWGVLLAVIFGVISGVYPAWRMSRLRPVQALKGADR